MPYKIPQPPLLFPALTPKTFYDLNWNPFPVHPPSSPVYENPKRVPAAVIKHCTTTPASNLLPPEDQHPYEPHSLVGKLPAIAGWRDRPKPAAFIPSHYTQPQPMNIGLNLPKTILVLDVDNHNPDPQNPSEPNQNLRQLCEDLSLNEDYLTHVKTKDEARNATWLQYLLSNDSPSRQGQLPDHFLRAITDPNLHTPPTPHPAKAHGASWGSSFYKRNPNPDDLTDEHGLPVTALDLMTPYRVLTGSKPHPGTHLAFRIPAEKATQIRKNLKSYPGIDFLNYKSMILAPGSVHRSNNYYTPCPLNFTPPCEDNLIGILQYFRASLPFDKAVKLKPEKLQRIRETEPELWQKLCDTYLPLLHAYTARLMLSWTPQAPAALLNVLTNNYTPRQFLFPKGLSPTPHASTLSDPNTSDSANPPIYETPESIDDLLSIYHNSTETPYDTDEDDPENHATAEDLFKHDPRTHTEATQLCKTHPAAIEGCGGNLTTFTLAARLNDLHLHPDTAMELMEIWYNPRCEPPWDSTELEQIIINAYTYCHRKPETAKQTIDRLFREARELAALTQEAETTTLTKEQATQSSADEFDTLMSQFIKDNEKLSPVPTPTPTQPSTPVQTAKEEPAEEPTGAPITQLTPKERPDTDIPLLPNIPPSDLYPKSSPDSGKTIYSFMPLDGQPHPAGNPQTRVPTKDKRLEIFNEYSGHQTRADIEEQLESERRTWMNEVEIITDEKSGATRLNPARKLKNISLFLTHLEEFQGLLSYSTFANQIIVTRPSPIFTNRIPELCPRNAKNFPHHIGVPLDDRIESIMKSYLERYSQFGLDDQMRDSLLYNGISVGKDQFTEAVQMAAYANPSHPVRDYALECLLKWDGETRLFDWLPQIANTKTDIYTRETGALMIQAIIARAFNPGHKFDYMFVLDGEEGVRKSTLCRTLAIRPEWFKESSMDIEDPKNIMEQTQSSLVVEMPELVGMYKREIEAMKHFITTTSDHGRPAYARYATTIKRQFILFGTTNDTQYLSDSSGKNRRFIPVNIPQIMDTTRLQHIMPQLIGEALWHYLLVRKESRRRRTDFANYELVLSQGADEIASNLRKDRLIQDDRFHQIEPWLNGDGTPEDFTWPAPTIYNRENNLVYAIDTQTIARVLFRMTMREVNPKAQREIKSLMTGHGWKHERIQYQKQRLRMFIRPNSERERHLYGVQTIEGKSYDMTGKVVEAKSATK